MLKQTTRERKPETTRQLPTPAPVEKEARQIVLTSFSSQETQGMKYCHNHFWSGNYCLYGAHTL